MESKKFNKFAAIAVSAVLGMVVQSPAADAWLNHGGSAAHIDLDSGAGMDTWSVGGQNQLAKQWFYYRTDSGVAKPINAISAANVLYSDATTLVAEYANLDFSLSISYILTGGGFGAGSADILETISINNLSGAPLNFHFFQYSDFNLLGTQGNDEVEFLSASSVIQTEGVFGIQEGIILPPSTYREAALAGPGGTLDNLLNTAGYNLNGNSGPLTGDVTWAFQWDHQIGIGQSLEIYKDKTLIVPVIPEPTVMSLVTMCLGAGFLLRRRHAK